MCTESYPVEILPTSGFISRIDADEILDIKNVYVHRRSDVSREDAFYGNIADRIHFKFDEIDEIIRHPFNLSLNLMGGKFEVSKHAKWNSHEKGSKYWLTDNDIEIADYEGCYSTIDETRPNFFFKYECLHNKPIDYPRTFNKESDSWQYTAVVKGATIDDIKRTSDGKKGEVEKNVKAKLFLVHRPTNLNYWHWQLESATLKKEFNKETGKEEIIIEPTLEKHKSKPKVENLLNAQMELLLTEITFDLPDYAIIPESVYLKTQS